MPCFWLSMKPWPLARVAGMAAFDGAALAADGGHDGFLGARLRRPALLVGGQAQIAVGN